MNEYCCSIDTIQGKINSMWHMSNNEYIWCINVPETIQYTLDLNDYHVKELKEEKGKIRVVFYE